MSSDGTLIGISATYTNNSHDEDIDEWIQYSLDNKAAKSVVAFDEDLRRGFPITHIYRNRTISHVATWHELDDCHHTTR